MPSVPRGGGAPLSWRADRKRSINLWDIMPTLIDTRRAGLGDIDAILADVEAGFATYV